MICISYIITKAITFIISYVTMRYRQNPDDPYFLRNFMEDFDFVVGAAVIFLGLWITIVLVMTFAHLFYPPEKTDCKYNHDQNNTQCMTKQQLFCRSEYYWCMDMSKNELMCQETQYKCLSK